MYIFQMRSLNGAVMVEVREETPDIVGHVQQTSYAYNLGNFHRLYSINLSCICWYSIDTKHISIAFKLWLHTYPYSTLGFFQIAFWTQLPGCCHARADFFQTQLYHHRCCGHHAVLTSQNWVCSRILWLRTKFQSKFKSFVYTQFNMSWECRDIAWIRMKFELVITCIKVKLGKHFSTVKIQDHAMNC